MELEEADPYQPGSHWDKRLCGNEYMSPEGGPQLFVSQLTLSFYEDMGWYQVNYAKSEGNRWGYQQGCNFVEKPCSAETWGRYFCSNASAGGCNGDQTAVAYCDLTVYNQALPVGYQYFSDPTLGGSDRFNNYCPIFEGYSNTYCQDIVSGTQFLGNNDPPQNGMVFSATSACFEFTFSGNPSLKGACYQLTCSTSNNVAVLSVNVYGTTVNCPPSGGTVSVNIPNTFTGELSPATLNCPPASFFCGANTQPVSYPPSTIVPTSGSNIITDNSSTNLVPFYVFVLLGICVLLMVIP